MDDLAAGLIAMGLTRGDRVGMWGPNMREWVITQFAAAKAGLILVSGLILVDEFHSVRVTSEHEEMQGAVLFICLAKDIVVNRELS